MISTDWRTKSGEWFQKFNKCARELKELKDNPFKGKSLVELVALQRELGGLVNRIAERTPPEGLPSWAVYATHTVRQGGMVFEGRPMFVNGQWEGSERSQSVSGWPVFDRERQESKRIFRIHR